MTYHEFKEDTKDQLALLETDDRKLIEAIIAKQGILKLGDVDRIKVTNDLVLMARDLRERGSTITEEFQGREEEIQQEILENLESTSWLEKLLGLSYELFFLYGFTFLFRWFINDGSFRTTLAREVFIFFICGIGILASGYVVGLYRLPGVSWSKKFLRVLLMAFPGVIFGAFFSQLNSGPYLIQGYQIGVVLMIVAVLCWFLLRQYREKLFSRSNYD